MDPYLGKGRNVTTDNFFTSLKLAKDLLKKKTSLIGTVNKVRRELPLSVMDLKPEMYSSVLHVHAGITLTTYRCKRRKNVVLMSTLHPSISISTEGKKLPETVSFYNSTKFGVDIVDQMARKYLTKAGCRRWPFHVFNNILDLAAINAWILFKEATGKTISRRDFLLQLAQELRKPYVDSRERVTRALRVSPDEFDQTVSSRKRRHCQVALCKGNKAFASCAKCQKTVWSMHG
jgi:hypothetical protein